MKAEIRPGDYFCVRTKSPISAPILFIEKSQALDKDARYNHAGIVVASDGTTFESLKKIAHYDIEGYRGCPMIVARHRGMTIPAFLKGYHEVKQWDQKAYPWWRLVLHFLGLAKWLHPIGIPVCSELVAEHAHHAGLCDADGYGWTPDNLADKWRESKYYDVIFEGEW